MTAKEIPDQNLIDQLTADHARIVKEFMTTHEERLTATARLSQLEDLLDALETVMIHLGTEVDRGAWRTDYSQQPPAGRTHQTSVARRRADQVVEFLRSIYPASMNAVQIWTEMERRGMKINSNKPANALYVSFYQDARIERVSRGAYRANQGKTAETSPDGQ